MRAPYARVNLLSGSVRSGKTFISLAKWAALVAAAPADYQFLMCGKTLESLRRNCFAYLTEICGSRFSYSAKRASLFSRTVWLEGASDARAEAKIRGMTLGGCYCDELSLFPEDFFLMALSRLSLPGAFLIATTNPDSPNHWLKRGYIDKSSEHRSLWEFTLEDNPFLDPAFVDSLKKDYSGVFYERFILGKWVAAEGSVYRDFAADPGRFISRAAGPFARVNIGVDFGGSRSASAFVATGFTPGFRSASVLCEELRPAASENPDSLTAAFIAFLERVKDAYPAAFDVYCDSAEQILIRGFRSAAASRGLAFQIRNARKLPITDRIRLTQKLLASGRLTVSPGCPNLASALAAAVWNPAKAADERLDDGSYCVDILDAFEYSVEPVSHLLR